MVFPAKAPYIAFIIINRWPERVSTPAVRTNVLCGVVVYTIVVPSQVFGGRKPFFAWDTLVWLGMVLIVTSTYCC